MSHSSRLLVLLLLLLSTQANAQRSYTPYPIVFVHGLDNNDKIWYNAFRDISKVYGDHLPTTGDDVGTVIHAMLNRYKGVTNMFGADGIAGTSDDDVYVNPTPPLPSGIYTLNFETSWNEVPSKPILYPYKDLWIVARESQSDQAALFKAGYALKKCIEHVLSVTGAEKVILFGYSMGGVVIREYLQRRVDSMPRWWVDPESADGHRVAKVVTLCSPHRGCDALKWVPLVAKGSDSTQTDIQLVNSSSEAVRDLRITYASGTQKAGVYLFGGYEGGLNTNWLFSGWHNADVDCNGRETDSIVGINPGLTSSMPLPSGLPYTYITSRFGSFASDLLVETERQYLVTDAGEIFPQGLADTMNIFFDHWSALSDAKTMLRALDEPSTPSMAYEIHAGKRYRGAVTIQSGGGTEDTDMYRMRLADASDRSRSLSIRLLDTVAPSRELTIRVYAASNNLVLERTVQAKTPERIRLDSATIASLGDELYLSISGVATRDSWKYPYEFSVDQLLAFIPRPQISGLADTAVACTDTLMDAFAISYSRPESLAISVSSSDTTVLPLSSIRILGDLPNLVLQVLPQESVTGTSVIRVTCADSTRSASTEYSVRVFADQRPEIYALNDTTTICTETVTNRFSVVYSDPASLDIAVTSSDTTVIPLANISVLGEAPQLAIQAVPLDCVLGASTIRVTFSNNNTSASAEFVLSVVEDQAPQITGLADTTVSCTETLLAPFSVVYSHPETLDVTVSSSDTTVIPLSNISIIGTPPQPVLQVTPVTCVSGTSVVRVTCSNASKSATSEFRVNVIEDNVTSVRSRASSSTSDITISPLPVMHEPLSVMLLRDDDEIVELTVLDGTGAVVHVWNRGSGSTPSRAVSIDASSFASGQYIMRITTTRGVVVRSVPVIR